MNMVKQILAFNDRLMIKPLSSGQIALWYALLHINNKASWIQEFSVANQTLEILCGLSRQGINKARNVLKQEGLIDFKSNGTRATSYKLAVLYTSDTSNSVQDSRQVNSNKKVDTSDSLQVGVQSSVQNSIQGSLQSSVQNSSTLNKQNKTKQNKTKKDINIFLSGDQEEKVQSILNYVKEKWQTQQVPIQLIASISDWVQIWDKDVLLKAFEITANSKKVKAFGIKGYVNAILTDWENNGVKALSDLEKPTKKSEKLPWWSEMTNDDWAVYEKLSADEKEKYQQERGA